MLKPEIKQKWVQALRSDEYEQTDGYLCKDGKFCCLGVLTDLYLKEHGEDWEREAGLNNSEDVLSYHGEYLDLPAAVANWSGLVDMRLPEPIAYRTEKDDDGTEFQAKAYTLVGLNDEAFYSFAQIADVIEESF